jgi:hypothetical protein
MENRLFAALLAGAARRKEKERRQAIPVPPHAFGEPVDAKSIADEVRARPEAFALAPVCHHELPALLAAAARRSGVWWLAVPCGLCEAGDGYEFLLITDKSACPDEGCILDHRVKPAKLAETVELLIRNHPEANHGIRCGGWSTAA